MLLKEVFVTIGLLSLGSSAYAAGFADEVLGPWDVTVRREDGSTYPSWFEIVLRKETELMASFVGRFGSVRHASRTTFEGGRLSLHVPVQYERFAHDVVLEGGVSSQGELSGSTVDDEGRSATWTAVRAPSLVRSAPGHWQAPVALFGADDLERWNGGGDCWTVAAGVVTNRPPCGNLVTTQAYDDFRLRAEFMLPPGGNSGVYLRGRYEVQLQDGMGQVPDALRHGAIYGFLRPSMMAARPAGEWQTLEVTLVGRRVSVVMNGFTILDSLLIPGITGGALDSREEEPGPIMLQGDHSQVWFRNVTISTPEGGGVGR